MNMKLWNNIGKKIDASEFDKAVAFLEKKIIGAGIVEFYPVVNSNFTNKKEDVLKRINKFIKKYSKKFTVKSIYLEMIINYDTWSFDSFAYDKVGNTKDQEWLCYFNSEPLYETVLVGMEPAQKVFNWYDNRECDDSCDGSHPEYEKVYECAVLLVMCKFVKFISEVVKSGELYLKIPVFVTAHDFDIIGKIKP